MHAGLVISIVHGNININCGNINWTLQIHSKLRQYQFFILFSNCSLLFQNSSKAIGRWAGEYRSACKEHQQYLRHADQFFPNSKLVLSAGVTIIGFIEFSVVG